MIVAIRKDAGPEKLAKLDSGLKDRGAFDVTGCDHVRIDLETCRSGVATRSWMP